VFSNSARSFTEPFHQFPPRPNCFRLIKVVTAFVTSNLLDRTTMRNEESWNLHLQQLRQSCQLNGNCTMRLHYRENEKLGRWVRRQRMLYRLWQHGKPTSLTYARISKLERIGFVWNPCDEAWMHRFQELAAYRDKHGHCNVPRSFPPSPTLPIWVKMQRLQYESKNKNMPLTDERIRQLESIAFVWKVGHPNETQELPPIPEIRKHDLKGAPPKPTAVISEKKVSMATSMSTKPKCPEEGEYQKEVRIFLRAWHGL
jgi:hypothetical protein